MMSWKIPSLAHPPAPKAPLFIPVIRFFIYSLAAYRHQLFIDMLDDARQEWRDWAGKHLGLLAHSRLTQIDEENKEGIVLSSLTPNKDNVLILNQLKSLHLWDKQEKAIQILLTPIAEYYHQYGLTQAITFYVQTEKMIPSLARHGCTLSLASEEPKKQLIVYQDNNRFLLQQITYDS